MYTFIDFAKLIILLLVIAIVFLVFRRLQRKKTEGPDTGDNE